MNDEKPEAQDDTPCWHVDITANCQMGFATEEEARAFMLAAGEPIKALGVTYEEFKPKAKHSGIHAVVESPYDAHALKNVAEMFSEALEEQLKKAKEIIMGNVVPGPTKPPAVH